MGNNREAVCILAQHFAPSAIFLAVCCPDVIAGRFPRTLVGGYTPTPGDEVVLRARVSEFFNLTQLSSASLVTVLAWCFCPSGHIPLEATAWYHKSEATFVDCLAVVRQQIWRVRYLVNSAPQADFVQLPREAFDLLCNDLPLAA